MDISAFRHEYYFPFEYLKKVAHQLNSEQLLGLFTSEETEECAQAVEYLFKQGVESFYFLLFMQGNKEPLRANLNHPLSGARTVMAFPSRF